MSKILKSVTLGDVKIGGIFRALGKEFVKLDADEHGCLVLAKDIWTRMPFRDGDDPEYPNDLRRSEIMPYLGNCLAEFTKNGTPLSTFIPLRNEFKTKEQRDNAFTVSIHRRNDMQDGLDNLYRRYVLPAPISDLMEIPYRAEQVWLVIRHALAWHDKPEGDPWNVCFDKPLNRSDQPQPVVKLNEKQEAKK